VPVNFHSSISVTGVSWYANVCLSLTNIGLSIFRNIAVLANIAIDCCFVGPIIPKYYYVTRDNVDFEKGNPGSQDRLASDEDAETGNIYLWGQSVYVISQLLSEWWFADAEHIVSFVDGLYFTFTDWMW